MGSSGPNSGQQGFSVGSEGRMDSQSYLHVLHPETSSNPLLEMFSAGNISMSEIRELQTFMGTQFNSQQYDQPAGTSSGVVHDQHLTNTNVSGTPEMTPEKIVNLKKREADRKYRERQKLGKIQMQNDLGRLYDENANLRKENESLKLAYEAQLKVIDQLKRDLAKLKSNNEMQNAAGQHLAKLLQLQDLEKSIKEGDKQDPFASDEERHSEKEISAGNLDGGDSKDENDSNKRKKRVADSAPSERRSGKVPKFACYDARADQRQGSTSNPTAMVIDPYSITECLRILKTMGNIPFPIVKKARAKFESADEREYFVGLTEDWRRDWVQDLENDA